MTTGSAPAHTASAASRGRKRSHSLLVTPRRGGLRTRQAHGTAARRRQGGNRQQRRDNDAQNKMHDAPPGSSGRPPARRIPVRRITYFGLILNWTKVQRFLSAAQLLLLASMSALPSKADVRIATVHVCFGTKADIVLNSHTQTNARMKTQFSVRIVLREHGGWARIGLRLLGGLVHVQRIWLTSARH